MIVIVESTKYFLEVNDAGLVSPNMYLDNWLDNGEDNGTMHVHTVH